MFLFIRPERLLMTDENLVQLSFPGKKRGPFIIHGDVPYNQVLTVTEKPEDTI